MDLLQTIKQRLRITWEDEVEDNNVKMIINAGTAYLDSVAGEEVDFEADSIALELLYCYILYARNDSVAAFRTAYSPDLLALSLKYKAKRLKEQRDEDKE